MNEQTSAYRYTWEQAIEVLRQDPRHRALVHDAYLTSDLTDNCNRFAASDEFAATLRLIQGYRPDARKLLDVPGGNGIATLAFARNGFDVTSVEPDPSDSVGRGAIRACLDSAGLRASIVDAYGEDLPFKDSDFDVVYVRQGLHHARDLPAMLTEYARVLRPGGLLVAAREHVVDDYGPSLQSFLDSQVDHQLYGGENAFARDDYHAAITKAGLALRQEFGPYDTPINLHPNTPEILREKILRSGPGRLLAKVFPENVIYQIGMWRLRRAKRPGRLYTFVATKA